jgi:hypothetical protein
MLNAGIFNKEAKLSILAYSGIINCIPEFNLQHSTSNIISAIFARLLRVRRQRTEDRRQKAEGRRQKAEGRRQKTNF